MTLLAEIYLFHIKKGPNMKTNTINGLMFMIAGLTPFVVYLGLGPDGTALLSAARTEQLFAYLFFSFPIAVMMTRKIENNYLTDAGLLILVASSSMGMVADALGAHADLSQMSDAVSITAYSSVMLGALLYGLGAFQTSIFPKWLSGLFAGVAGAAFIVLAISEPIDLDTNAAIIPFFLVFHLLMIVLGIFMIRRST